MRGERRQDDRGPTGTDEFVPRPGARFTAVVDDLTQEGAGVARLGRLVVFVPGAVPGDRIEARLVRIKKGWAEGHLLRVALPSPDRRVAPCPHQGACGGCPSMVLDEAAALALKARHLEQVLRRIGRIEHGVDRLVASPAALHYRGRVRFAVAPREDAPRFGYRPRGAGDALVPIETCLLAPPRASELARLFLAEIDRVTAAEGRPWPHHVSVRGSFASGEWLVVIHGPAGSWPEASHAARALAAAAPDVAGVIRIAEEPGRWPRELLLAGKDSVVERIGAAEVELGATTFLQVNPAAAALLYDEVRASLGAPRRVLDLYCGVGLVGLLAVDRGVDVLGVELHPGAIERAERAATRNGMSPRAFRTGDAPAAARALAAAGERFDRVVLNPPRAGAGPELGATMRDLGAEVVVMVSCHPAAMARDLAGFAGAGYAIDRLAAVDLFPQTPHLEAVARLVRKDA